MRKFEKPYVDIVKVSLIHTKLLYGILPCTQTYFTSLWHSVLVTMLFRIHNELTNSLHQIHKEKPFSSESEITVKNIYILNASEEKFGRRPLFSFCTGSLGS